MSNCIFFFPNNYYPVTQWSNQTQQQPQDSKYVEQLKRLNAHLEEELSQTALMQPPTPFQFEVTSKPVITLPSKKKGTVEQKISQLDQLLTTKLDFDTFRNAFKQCHLLYSDLLEICPLLAEMKQAQERLRKRKEKEIAHNHTLISLYNLLNNDNRFKFLYTYELKKICPKLNQNQIDKFLTLSKLDMWNDLDKQQVIILLKAYQFEELLDHLNIEEILKTVTTFRSNKIWHILDEQKVMDALKGLQLNIHYIGLDEQQTEDLVKIHNLHINWETSDEQDIISTLQKHQLNTLYEWWGKDKIVEILTTSELDIISKRVKVKNIIEILKMHKSNCIHKLFSKEESIINEYSKLESTTDAQYTNKLHNHLLDLQNKSEYQSVIDSMMNLFHCVEKDPERIKTFQSYKDKKTPIPKLKVSASFIRWLAETYANFEHTVPDISGLDKIKDLFIERFIQARNSQQKEQEIKSNPTVQFIAFCIATKLSEDSANLSNGFLHALLTRSNLFFNKDKETTVRFTLKEMKKLEVRFLEAIKFDVSIPWSSEKNQNEQDKSNIEPANG